MPQALSTLRYTAPSRPCARRGSAYILVLMTLTIVMVIGLTGVAAQRDRLRAASAGFDAVEARASAESGLDLAMQLIADKSNWRSLVPGGGDWVSGQAIGRGRLTINITDTADGILTGSSDDPILVKSTATAGQARQILSVRMEARYDALSSLAVACSVGGNAAFSAYTIAADQPITSNGSISATGSTINAPVEAAASITGSTYAGTTKANAGTRALPASSALDSYLTRGTSIAIALIPSRRIEKTVLGPGINPFGLPNAEGIYVIDCLGQDLELRDCRIYGSLIVLNCSGGLRIRNSVNFETTSLAIPALCVVGPLTLELNGAVLSESSVGANLNPAGAPYSGASDNDSTDTYPSTITGLVYINGNIQVNVPSSASGTQNVIKGILISSGKLQCDGPLNITYQPAIYATPPSGFRGNYRMVVTPNSWAQIVE